MSFFPSWYYERDWIWWTTKNTETGCYPSPKLMCIFSFKLLNVRLLIIKFLNYFQCIWQWTVTWVTPKLTVVASVNMFRRRREPGVVSLLLPVQGTAERSHERALEGENRQKMRSWKPAAQGTPGARLPASNYNKWRSNRSHSSCLHKRKSKTWEVSPARHSGLKPAKGAEKGLLVPRGCAGASGGTGRDSRKWGP